MELISSASLDASLYSFIHGSEDEAIAGRSGNRRSIGTGASVASAPPPLLVFSLAFVRFSVPLTELWARIELADGG
jgi:hypothetical protein